MGFRPEEIALKRFVIRWRGYDTQEVDGFLRAVADDYRQIIEEAKSALTVHGDSIRSGLNGSMREVPHELTHLLDRLNVVVGRLEAADPVDTYEHAGHRRVDVINANVRSDWSMRNLQR